MKNTKNNIPFSAYQKGVIALLAFLQFTVVLDFMVMAPLGDLLMKTMQLHATQFASAVSAYAFSAGISGLAAAGFADKYDRKKILLFFYMGFMGGTLLCATANTYEWLLIGRIVTGLSWWRTGICFDGNCGGPLFFCSKRPCNGVCANGFCREPGGRHSYWSLSC